MDLNTYLKSLSEKLVLNETEQQKINKSIESLKKKIWGHYQNKLSDVILFGSYDRGTILPRKVDEDSDVDILMIHKSGDLQPQTYLSQLKGFAENNYATSEIRQVHPTITLELEHIRFEIVPGYQNREIKIPAPRLKEISWISTDPIGFKEKLSIKNQNNYQLITPIIRVFKYWNCLNGRPFSSYKLEHFIVNTKYYDCSTLQHYFNSIVYELNESELTNDQEEKIKPLVECRRRIKVMIKEEMTDLIEGELQNIIPMI